MKKIFKTILLVIILILIGINIPITHLSYKKSTKDYNNWMKENISDNRRIIDIKMLGAHDTFSSHIHLFSKIDPYAPSVFKSIPGRLLKGFFIRQSVTQISGAKELLKSGVRYFDIRLSLIDNTWHTKHNYISEEFDAKEIVDYLKSYPGEFLVLDFQHINGVDYNNKEDYLKYQDMLKDLGLLDFNYKGSEDVADIRYDEITNQKKQSRVIIIDKFTYKDKKTYYYQDAIVSNWANSDDFNTVFNFLKEDGKKTKDERKFKVMQAVTTIQASPSGFLNSFKTWSLLNRASKFNRYLISQKDFDKMLFNTPIVMVDYSNTNKNNFLDQMMKLIINANKK